jgi:hypothetical protein
MTKLSRGRSQSVGSRVPWLQACVMTVVATCYGCRDESYWNQLMKSAPPESEICGDWRVDLVKTNWHQATPLLQREGQNGRLLVRSNGTFSFKEMPDFSVRGIGAQPLTFRHYGSGEWWTGVNEINPEPVAYLWLNIEEMDGQQKQQTSGVAYFRRTEDKYFLCFAIREPGSDVLVLKKVGKAAPDQRPLPTGGEKVGR